MTWRIDKPGCDVGDLVVIETIDKREFAGMLEYASPDFLVIDGLGYAADMITAIDPL